MMKYFCLNGSNAKNVCVNPQCEAHAFNCLSLKCCGPSQHQRCETLNFAEYSTQVQQGVQQLSKISSSVRQFYSDLSKQIKAQAEIACELIEKKMQFRESLNQFSKKGSFSKGKNISAILKQLKCYPDQFEEEIYANISNSSKVIQDQLKDFKQVIQEGFQTSENTRISTRHRNSFTSFNSKILTLPEEEQLSYLVFDKKFKSKKIFTASEHHFSVSQFHKRCDGKSNLLILMKNSKNMIYGGYSPCQWESNRSGVYKSDENLESFVFNLTRKTKYPLIDSKYAIQCHQLFGPIFGRGGMIMVNDKSNKFPNYWQDLPISYQAKKEKKWTVQEFTDFVGAGPGQRYTLIEWEAFEIHFQK